MTPPEKKSITKRFYLSWIIVYLLMISGVAAYGATVYQKYDERQLPSGYVQLSVSKSHYQPGETVSFTVTNHFPVAIYVTNECPKEPLNVYRWESEQWIELHDTASDDSECYTEPRRVPIPSEGAQSYDFADWPNLFAKPGVYRIATAIDHYGDVPFQDFVVLEPAEVIQVPVTVTAPSKPSPTPTVPAANLTPPAAPTPVNIQEEQYFEDEDDYENEHESEYDDD
jgi:hypothetical protein